MPLMLKLWSALIHRPLANIRLGSKTKNCNLEKIRRGPKLEGYAFANFGYSSGTVEVVL